LGIPFGVAGHDHTVIARGTLDGHVAVADVAQHPLGLALERVSPPAAAGGDVAELRPRPCLPERHAVRVPVDAVVHPRHMGLLAGLVADPDAPGRAVASSADAEAGRA